MSNTAKLVAFVLVLLLTFLFLNGQSPRIVVNTAYFYLATGGDGRTDLNIGDSAPNGRPNPGNKAQGCVLQELIQHGSGTTPELVERLKAEGYIFSPTEINAAISDWTKRGWVKVTDGKAHISQALLEYIK